MLVSASTRDKLKSKHRMGREERVQVKGIAHEVIIHQITAMEEPQA